MNPKYITIVSCTQKTEEEFKETPLGLSIDKLQLVHHVFYENKEGIPKCYNEAIKEVGEDYVIFVHDDVYINDAFLEEKLEEGFKTYDVLGLAGSNFFSIKRDPLCWHNSPKESWSGSVMHPGKDGQHGLFMVTTFGAWPREAIVLDGLFIAVNMDKLGDVRFDENFTFDFYDTSFCIKAHQAGLKLGTVPVICTHMSHGVGIMKDSYKEAQKKFVELYKEK